jgi:heme a synthase
VGYWLLGMSASVLGLVCVGGITRLTESGLSMVEWRPVTGWLPPMSESDWLSEFDKYKAYPEYVRANHDMTLDDFKSIYFWEYSHRVVGRLVGSSFALGMLYFGARGRLRGALLAKVSAILAGIGAQGALGWHMVKSGLEHRDDAVKPRVKATRLAAHLGAAFALYAGMLYTAIGELAVPNAKRAVAGNAAAALGASATLRPAAIATASLVFATAISGALVAGIRAGRMYNTWPLMADRVVPEDYLSMEPLSRNFLENDACVQFNHRALAYATFGSCVALWVALRRRAAHLPFMASLAAHHVAGMAALQVGLGIATLLYFVPTPLAATHQMGSLMLLSSCLWLIRELEPRRWLVKLVPK